MTDHRRARLRRTQRADLAECRFCDSWVHKHLLVSNYLSRYLVHQFRLSLISLFLVGVFFSGLYPHLYYPVGFKPIEVLKGKSYNNAKKFSAQNLWLYFNLQPLCFY